MLIALGCVRGAHGLHGTLKCAYITDRPDTLKDYPLFLLTDSESGEVILLDHVEVSLRGKDFLLFTRFIGDRTGAERFKSWFIEVPLEFVPKRPDGEYFHWQLEGLDVFSESGELLGSVKEVILNPGQMLLDVKSKEREFYVVFCSDQVVQVDIEKGRITVADHVGRGFQ